NRPTCRYFANVRLLGCFAFDAAGEQVLHQGSLPLPLQGYLSFPGLNGLLDALQYPCCGSLLVRGREWYLDVQKLCQVNTCLPDVSAAHALEHALVPLLE